MTSLHVGSLYKAIRVTCQIKKMTLISPMHNEKCNVVSVFDLLYSTTTCITRLESGSGVLSLLYSTTRLFVLGDLSLCGRKVKTQLGVAISPFGRNDWIPC